MRSSRFSAKTPNAQSSCAVRVGWLCLLAAHTVLSRLAALANLNNGRLLLIKTKPVNCETTRQLEPVKLFKRSHKEQRHCANKDCTKPTNWRTLTFGAAAKKTKHEQCQNKTTN